MVTSVRLPPPSLGGRYFYLKSRIRNVFDFAIASVAVNLTITGSHVSSSRVVFGGVAPAPYRDLGVERKIDGAPVASISVDDVASVALSAATPLQNNGYKVDVAKGLLKEALGQLLI